jgi:uncharacterized protein (TIGR00375 family)
MKFIGDLHIHSHYSRATSGDLVPEQLAFWAQKKGITLVGSGDFTHPGWVAELKEKLVEAENGLFRLSPALEQEVNQKVPAACQAPVRFILTGEISCIYKRAGQTRKIHNLILMPGFKELEQLNAKLNRIGNIKSDGRPILGLDSRDLLEIVLETSARAFFIPAHIWTPWFSLFGSKSGFNTIEECFGDLTPHIHALETGLSSDPDMNRLLSMLDPYLLISNSDAHSPAKLGREANLFDTDLDYDRILAALTDQKGFAGTLEFFPEEGKYHLDGHRKCEVCLEPEATHTHQGLCPKCGKPLTLGVLYRVQELGDRQKPQLSKPFYSLIPLQEILGEILGCGPASKKVVETYETLLHKLGPELPILRQIPLEKIAAAGSPLLAKAIERMRKAEVIRDPGYDGEYGRIRLFEEAEKESIMGQTALFAMATPKKPKAKRAEPAGQPAAETRTRTGAASKTIFADPILGPLNDEQRAAVLHQGENLLIIAGPGTGKTLTLTHRIAHLLQSGQARPEAILSLTFTNKAAREMQTRLTKLLPVGQTEKMHISTFHRFCLDVLRQQSRVIGLAPNFNLLPEQDFAPLVRQSLTAAGTKTQDINRFLKALPQLKTASVLSPAEPLASDLMSFLKIYQSRLKELGSLDLLDLETETLRLFQNHPEIVALYSAKFPWILVDEYQDTNPLQSAILKYLAQKDTNHICAIGDPDQAIYGFRGADVKNFLRFIEEFAPAQTITLNRNYRSSQTILDSAAALLEKEAPLKSDRGAGEQLRLAACRTDAEEAEMIVEQIEKLLGGTTHFSLDSGRVASHEKGADLSFGDLAVLFRLNTQADVLETAFSRAGIPYVRSGEKPLVEQYPVNILWRFLRALAAPADSFYRQSYLEMPDLRNGLEALRQCSTDQPLAELIHQAVLLHGFDLSAPCSQEILLRFQTLAEQPGLTLNSFLDRLALEQGIDHETLLGDRVALMSLHAAKGLEWPTVFITGCEDGLIPCTLFKDHDAAEEKRLLYVGLTRAQSLLVLSYAGRRSLNNRPLQMQPSPFLAQLPQHLCRELERSKWKRKKPKETQLSLFGK